MCVTLGGILSDCFALVFCFGFYSRGTQHFTGTVSNEATSEMGYPAWPAGRTCNFPFPNGMRLSLEPPDMTCTLRRHLVGSSFVFLFLALLPLEDLQDPVVRTCTLRNWNPRPACGTAIKSVRISISVFGLVPTRDEPAECLPWTRRAGVCRTYPLPGYRAAASVGGLCLKNWDVCLVFGIPSWLMPLRDRSGQSSQPFRQGAR